MSALGLVADYGSSSDEEDSTPNPVLEKTTESKKEIIPVNQEVNYLESNDIIDKPKIKKHKKKKKSKSKESKEKVLPSPFSKTNIASVFFNPFQKDQEIKDSTLEKHVRMTDNPKNVIEINGKKICWNYRKGRCKFGHNCKFAHDSDLALPQNNKIPEPAPPKPNVSYNYSAPPIIEEELEETTNRKRRAGLAKGLVPSKKARQMYEQQQLKEAPWLVKR